MPHAERQAIFIVTDYFPSTGGPSSSSRAIAQELILRGWTIRVGTRRLSRKWLRDEVIDGVHVHRSGRPGYGKLSKLCDLVGTWWWLFRIGRNATVLQVFMDPDYALAGAAAGLGRRTVMKWATLGDPERYLGPQPVRYLKVRALRRSLNISLTQSMAQELKECGIKSDAIIPVSFDTLRFAPASVSERSEARTRLGITADVTIVFTGHLEPRKGIDLLLQAFGAIVAEGASAHLLVVGGNHGHAPDLGPALKSYVRSHGLDERVTFAGVVDDVVPYLRASDIFCLPSTREGMSNSMVEAMACGLACIAPASAGGDDLLSDGAGLIPASNSPAELARALTQLLGDSELRSRLGTRAAARVEAHRLPSVVDAFERMYATLPTRCGQRGVRRRTP